VRPGRYSRHSWLAWRLWFLERLAEVCHLERVAGTPWALRYARICGAEVGERARLGTLPPLTGLLSVGADATLEGDIDVRGWWIEGDELVLGKMRVGPAARVATRTTLMQGADIGAGAEIEPGSVVSGHIPPGELWAGSPARYKGAAGENWPTIAPEPSKRQRVWKLMFGVGLATATVLPLIAAVPGLLLLSALGSHAGTTHASLAAILADPPSFAATFLLTYALLVAALVRSVSPLLTPGWHGDTGGAGWALWFTETLMAGTRAILFPLYASVYARPWLRLLGLKVGKRTEVSTAVGLNQLTTLGETSFLADDVVFTVARARGGWLALAPISVGSRTFIGSSAILRSGTKLGDDCLVGLLSSTPEVSANGTSWLGQPAIALPTAPTPRAPPTHRGGSCSPAAQPSSCASCCRPPSR
jgi:non-ribosomal peptide synthetase-like protein